MTATGNYKLGIDLGTTYTAAAIARDDTVEVVGLGNRATAVPSVVHLGADGTTLIGEAADRRGPAEPDRVAREFKRRLGDPTPLLLGGSPHSAEALTATLLRWVVDKVTELEGGAPDAIALTRPANWGPYKQDLLDQAARLADVTPTLTLTEPEAAAIAYAANERVEPGALIAVYDLGGGTFDAAVLRKTADGFDILGEPEGIERLGGIDFDEAVTGHVRAALGGALDGLDVDDPATLAGLTRLRRDCIDAKEALSSDTAVSIPVLLPGVQTDVRLTRVEFEQLVRPTLVATVDAMRRALSSASVEVTDVASVLLVGGSSRIPLVAELVSDAFGRPIAVDAHPKHVVARGAAVSLLDDAGARAGAASHATAAPSADAVVTGVAAAGAAVVGAAAVSADAPDDVPRRPGATAASAATRPGADHREQATDQPALDPVGDPGWVLPAARGGGRMRRMVWAGIAGTLLVGVLVASAAARSRGPEPSGADATTPAAADAVEEPEQPDTGQRRDRSAGGTIGSDGGGTVSGDAGDGGGDTDTGTVEQPPPTEAATDAGETGTGDATTGDAGATGDTGTTDDTGATEGADTTGETGDGDGADADAAAAGDPIAAPEDDAGPVDETVADLPVEPDDGGLQPGAAQD